MSNIASSVVSFDTKEEYRIVKVICLGKDDVREATEAAPFGVDGGPLKDMIAVYADTVDKGEPVIVGYLNAPQLAQAGELRLYSTDADGQQQFYAWLKGNGTLELGGDADNMVRYSKLEEAFNTLKDDFNAFIDRYNLHIHIAPSGGGPTAAPDTAPPKPALVHTTADISPAKIDEIKTL